MSTRIAVMNQGYIEQIGTPREIYEYPQTCYVADFIGVANMFDGQVAANMADTAQVHCPELGVPVQVDQASGVPVGASVTVMVRPEKMKVTRERPAEDTNVIRGVVKEIAYLGDISIYHFQLDSGKMVEVSLTNLRHTAEQPLTWDDEVWISWHPANAVLLTQ